MITGSRTQQRIASKAENTQLRRRVAKTLKRWRNPNVIARVQIADAKRPKLVEVVWMDAVAHYSQSYEPELNQTGHGCIQYTPGYLVKETEDFVCIAWEHGESGYRDGTEIPRDLVIEIRELKEIVRKANKK